MNRNERNVYCIVRVNPAVDLAWVEAVLTELFWDEKLSQEDYGSLFDSIMYSPDKFTTDYDWTKRKY